MSSKTLEFILTNVFFSFLILPHHFNYSHNYHLSLPLNFPQVPEENTQALFWTMDHQSRQNHPNCCLFMFIKLPVLRRAF